jgi:tripartite-type tricarboxylate transporter receptor subunit TctC
MKKSILVVLGLVCALSMVSASGTKDKVDASSYPERSVTCIIPFGAGGGTDVWNRAVMSELGKALDVTLICQNMTGGSAGSIGDNYVWKSKHDGYTLSGTSETPLTIPVMTGIEQTTKDWEYFIAAGSPGLLCVNKKSQYKNFDDVLKALKANPESVSIAGTQGGLWFALAKLFDSYGDVPFKWLPYDGSSTAIKGSVSNEADCVVASAGEVKDYIRSGDLIPLAVMGLNDWEFKGYGIIPSVTKKVPALKNYLPLNQFLAFKVPSDTDPVILAKLTTAFNAAMKSDTIAKFADEQMAIVYNLTGAEAKEMAGSIESKLCWVLYDMGMTKFSPEEFGIPQP